MLKRLTINQFVIIDKLSLDFQPGLTVLTGETGAGKSILMDAMGLVLGDPPDRESIREGSPELMVEAVFKMAAGHPVWAYLATQQIPANPEMDLIVQRTIGLPDRDQILVGGKVVELDVLKNIGTYLVEIHGQFANQHLLSPATQLSLLDAFGNYPPEILGNVARCYWDILRMTKELEDERVFISRFINEERKIERTLNELKTIGMRKGLYEEVRDEHRRMTNIKITNEIFKSVHSQLVAGSGAQQALLKANTTVARQKELDGDALIPLASHLAQALEHTRVSIEEMVKLMPQYDTDISALGMLGEKLEAMKRIALALKIEPEKLFDLYQDLSDKLARIRNSRALIRKLDEALAKTQTEYRTHAHVLTEERIKAGMALSGAITAEMAPLKLLHAEFAIEVAEKISDPWTERGFNNVTFTARMNPGMPFSIIAKTASGGELARLILALKVVLRGVQTTPTFVFDEVDSDVGGAAAAAVGERIARLATSAQVLVITHSPQVASRGAQHLRVSKKTDKVTTRTFVETLSVDDRLDEISRMLAGDTITPESRAAATSLIDEARRAAETRRPENRQPL